MEQAIKFSKKIHTHIHTSNIHTYTHTYTHTYIHIHSTDPVSASIASEYGTC